MWINWLMRISLTLEETSDGTGSSCPWCPCGPEVPDRAGVWSSILSGARTPSLLQPSTVCSHSWSAAAVPVPCTAKHPSHMIYPGRSRTTGRISLWWPLLSIASLTGGLGHVSPLLFYCTNGQSQNRNTVRGCVCSYWTLSGFAYLSCTDKMIPQWLFCKVLHCSLFNIDSFQMAIRTRKKILKKWRNTTPRPSQVSEKSRVPPPPNPHLWVVTPSVVQQCETDLVQPLDFAGIVVETLKCPTADVPWAHQATLNLSWGRHRKRNEQL